MVTLPITLNDRDSSPQITHIFTFWVFFHIAGKTEDSLQSLHTDRKYQLSLRSWDDKTEQKSAWLISGQLYRGTAERTVFKVVRGYAIPNIKLKMTNDRRMGVVKVTWPIFKFCCRIISFEHIFWTGEDRHFKIGCWLIVRLPVYMHNRLPPNRVCVKWPL